MEPSQLIFNSKVDVLLYTDPKSPGPGTHLEIAFNGKRYTYLLGFKAGEKEYDLDANSSSPMLTWSIPCKKEQLEKLEKIASKGLGCAGLSCSHSAFNILEECHLIKVPFVIKQSPLLCAAYLTLHSKLYSKQNIQINPGSKQGLLGRIKNAVSKKFAYPVSGPQSNRQHYYKVFLTPPVFFESFFLFYYASNHLVLSSLMLVSLSITSKIVNKVGKCFY